MTYRISRRGFVAGASGSVAGVSAAAAQATASYVHPNFASASQKLSGNRWRDLADEVASLPPQSAWVLLGDLGDAAPLDLPTGDLADQAMGKTIIGAFEIEWAWRHRGSGVASTVTPAGFRGFERQLASARVHLEEATSADSDNGVARGLSFNVYKGQNDAEALYGAIRPFLMSERRPVGGLLAFGSAISSRWHGSEMECIAFAREVVGLDVPASCGVMPKLHYDNATARLMTRTPENPPEVIAAYFAEASVRDDIFAANDMYWSYTPDPDPFANWQANATFSYVLMLLGDAGNARRHLTAMGNYVGGPWLDFPDPRAAIQGARRQLGIDSL